jgi:hypothetical protein
MAKRLLLGIIKGLVIGVGLAFGVMKLQGGPALTGVTSYVFAVVAGLLVGLIAGRPVWARDAKVEASIKALVGAGISAGLLFVLRRWLNVGVDFASFGIGPGKLGELALTALPTISVALALMFELDDAVGGSPNAAPKASTARLRAPSDGSNLTNDLNESLENELEDNEPSARRNQKR